MRLAIALLALALTACTAGPGSRDRYARLLTPAANPSKVVAAELELARAAQEDPRALPQADRDAARMRPVVGRQFHHQRPHQAAGAGEALHQPGDEQSTEDAGEARAVDLVVNDFRCDTDVGE